MASHEKIGVCAREPHRPVLLREVTEAFSSRPIRVFVDATLGAGGHAEAILEAHPEIELFIGIDQDPLALQIAARRLERFGSAVSLQHGNFRHLEAIVRGLGSASVDGILMDIGVSSMQLDVGERGFSFSKEGPLDMRMDPTAPLDAAEIINSWPEESLAECFWTYGEMPMGRKVARAILVARESRRIATTGELCQLLEPIIGLGGRGRLHPMTLVFQALRIAVNDELGALERAIPQAIDLLAPHGRIAIISFHSLEDRRVKTHYRRESSGVEEDQLNPFSCTKKKERRLRLVTSKAIGPSIGEAKQNPRSRSAKLRVAERLEET